MSATTASSPGPTTPARPAARVGRIALWALQIVLAGVYFFSAWNKLTMEPVSTAGFEAMGFGVIGMMIIGVLELLGGIGLLVPRIAGLASACLVALMVGAVIATLASGGGSLVVIPGTVLVLVGIVAFVRRREVPALVRSLAPRG